MSANAPFISIIIPAYNVESYIARCLDSAVNQTLRDIEILIIDDCGADNSINIAKDYAKRDSRIKIIHNAQNLGTFAARMEGIKHAQGEYVLFLDADDYLERVACEKAYTAVVGDSSLGNHSADLANFEGSQTSSLASPPKFAKNHESNTANTRIVLDSATDSATNSDSSVDSSPSLAEGVRGWVKSPNNTESTPNLEPTTKTNPSLRGSVANEAIRNKSVDCHEFSNENSRNDENKDTSGIRPQYDTHPLTPSAREGEESTTDFSNPANANADSKNLAISNAKKPTQKANSSIFDEKSRFSSTRQGSYLVGNDRSRVRRIRDLSLKDEFAPDIVFFGMRFDPPTWKRVSPPVLTKPLRNEEILYEVFANCATPPWHICAKLYKASHIADVSALIAAHMGEGTRLTMAEDVLKSFYICALAKSSIGIPDKLYVYCDSASSITRKIDTATRDRKVSDISRVINEIKSLEKIPQIAANKAFPAAQKRAIKILESVIALEYRYDCDGGGQ